MLHLMHHQLATHQLATHQSQCDKDGYGTLHNMYNRKLALRLYTIYIITLSAALLCYIQYHAAIAPVFQILGTRIMDGRIMGGSIMGTGIMGTGIMGGCLLFSDTVNPPSADQEHPCPSYRG